MNSRAFIGYHKSRSQLQFQDLFSKCLAVQNFTIEETKICGGAHELFIVAILAIMANEEVHLRMSRRSIKSSPIFRNDRGEEILPNHVSATEAKNGFGGVLEMALQGRPTVITKHGDAKAVLISVEGYERLGGSRTSNLNTLAAEFDELFVGMQKPSAQKAMKTAFDASPKELAKAAVRGARRRK